MPQRSPLQEITCPESKSESMLIRLPALADCPVSRSLAKTCLASQIPDNECVVIGTALDQKHETHFHQLLAIPSFQPCDVDSDSSAGISSPTCRQLSALKSATQTDRRHCQRPDSAIDDLLEGTVLALADGIDPETLKVFNENRDKVLLPTMT
jgi:hypothetical protein